MKSFLILFFLMICLTGCDNNNSKEQEITNLNEQLEMSQKELNNQHQEIIKYQEELAKNVKIMEGSGFGNKINARYESDDVLPTEMQVYSNTKTSFSNFEAQVGVTLSKAMVIVNHLSYFTYIRNDVAEEQDSLTQNLLNKKITLNETTDDKYNYFLQLVFELPVNWYMTTHNGEEIFITSEVWFIVQDNGIPSFYIKNENENFIRYDCEPGFDYDWKLWVKTLFDLDSNLQHSIGEVP